MNLLNSSERPAIILGGGIRNSKSTNVMNKLIGKLNLPIVNTWSGLDSIPRNHKDFIGTIGVYGNRPQILQFKTLTIKYWKQIRH